MNFIVNHSKDTHQFVVIVEGKVATLDYSVSADGKILDYYSTFVPKELRGRNIGQDIVKYALEYAKDNQLKIKPTCPFVKRMIDEHPEYQSIIS
jgi:hypothetical protein